MNSAPHHRSTGKPFVAQQKDRRGTLMVELVVCTILLSVVGAILVPGIQAVNRQRKATQYETLTLIELNNLAAKLTVGVAPTDLRLTDSFATRYRDATVSTSSVKETEAAALRSTISIRCPDYGGRPDIVRSLTVWSEEMVVPQ